MVLPPNEVPPASPRVMIKLAELFADTGAQPG